MRTLSIPKTLAYWARAQFLVMELIDGADLSQISHEVGPLPTADACSVIAQAATGLQYAHEKKFVHRDIKPHNLMLTREGQVKVMDLGLALCDVESHLVEQLTQEGRPYGTVDYMAPEQCKNAPRGRYSGRYLQSGMHALSIAKWPAAVWDRRLQQRVFEDVGPLQRIRADIRQLRNDLPKELLTILKRMLDKDPAKRFSVPIEVAQGSRRWPQAPICRRLFDVFASHRWTTRCRSTKPTARR